MNKIIMACDHDWIKNDKESVRKCIDYSGFRVGVFNCECSKCGRKEQRKYY